MEINLQLPYHWLANPFDSFVSGFFFYIHAKSKIVYANHLFLEI